MKKETLIRLLGDVKEGLLTPEAASEQLTHLPFEDTGFAKIDHHRSLRNGMPEVIFAGGKTSDQVAEIFARMAQSGVNVLATHASVEAFAAVLKRVPQAEYHSIARIILMRQHEEKLQGRVAVLCAGTSDLPVAEEAAVSAEVLGAQVDRMYDVGVAGLHRLLAQREQLRHAQAVVVCAGMEGALPSVVGGLVRVPVIAVPTSVGYGASFSGVAALLGMLNSCSPNVTVVNIDNGFGAGYVATLIARAAASEPGSELT
ncbi:MAG: nickel pincer cofactor biosynthesis protein LarB [Acidobacteriaceae bacterium]